MDSSVKKTIKFYDKYAKQYSDSTSLILLQYQLNQFISFLQGKKVLDVGCGAGRDTAYFMEEKLDVIGIDAAEGMIKEAKKRVKKGKFKVMNFLELKFKDKSFDGIWCCAALFHLRKKDAGKAIKEFHKVLKDNGAIYITVKEGEGEKVLDSKYIAKEPRFYSFYKQAELEALLEKNGFEILTAYPEETDNTVWLNVFARKSKKQ